MVWYCSCTLRLLKLMCANLLYTVYTHALCVLVSVFASVYRIPFFAWLTSVVNNNLLPTACAPLFHSFASLSFSCILLNRHLFSAQIIHSFTHSLFLGLPLSLSLSSSEHLWLCFSFVCIYWALHFNVELFFSQPYNANRLQLLTGSVFNQNNGWVFINCKCPFSLVVIFSRSVQFFYFGMAARLQPKCIKWRDWAEQIDREHRIKYFLALLWLLDINSYGPTLRCVCTRPAMMK